MILILGVATAMMLNVMLLLTTVEAVTQVMLLVSAQVIASPLLGA